MERGFFEDHQDEIFTWAGETFDQASDCIRKSYSSSDEYEAGTVTVQPCTNIQDESAWIAQKILTSKNSLHRTAIFLNDFRNQRTYIEHSLKQFHIPYVVYGGEPLSATPLGQALEQLTELFFQNWKRDSWIRFLQSFPFNPQLVEKNGTPDQWNQWTIRANITDKNTLFIQRLEHLAKIQPDSKLQAFIDWQRELLSSLNKIERSFSNDSTMFFKNLFDWVQSHAHIDQIADEFSVFFDDLIYFSKNSIALEWNEIKPIIVEKLHAPAIQNKVFESDGVFIAPIHVMPGLSFDTIFFPHMNEGYFPKPSSQNFDITSQEMFKISQILRIKFPSAENDFNLQKVLFDTAISRTMNLFISYALTSLPNQEELRPSVFIHDFSKEKMFIPHIKFTSSAKFDSNFSKQVEKYVAESRTKSWSEYNALISSPQRKSHTLRATFSCI
ncbi:MAG: 3'-5' exonuclease [Bdellovibrionota bacterium]